jgi:preprotein translocase subunit YajC
MPFLQNLFSEITALEVALFTAFFILLVILIFFFQSSRIQSKIMKESSCYKESQLSTERGIFNTTAKIKNRPAFGVSYNFDDKTSKITCACPAGDVQNEFTNIPYYDLRENTPYKKRKKTQDTLTCSCESNISAAASDPKVSYYGEPGINKFMYNNNNTGFFDNIIYGSNYEFKTGRS